MRRAQPLGLVGALLGATLVCVLAAASAAADAELYRWIDSTGIVRYVTDPGFVPSSQRDSLQVVRPGMEPAPPAAPAEPDAAAVSTFPSVIGSQVPEPSSRLSDSGLPAPGPTAVAGAQAGEAAGGAAADPAGGAAGDAAEKEGKAGGAAAGEAASGAPAKDLATRIRELEQAIARDENTLKDLITTPPKEGEQGIESSAELREIARRLPGMQAELRALKQQQAVEGP